MTAGNVIQMAERLKDESRVILLGLEDQKEPVDDNKKIEEVASLSAKDKEIGRMNSLRFIKKSY